MTYSRHKSKQLIRIAVTPQMQGLIDKYKTENEYLFPIISGEYASGYKQNRLALGRINRHLKKIGQQLVLPIPLTTYCARHSWATIARDKNVPLAFISEALGHDNEQTTRIYLDSIRTSVVDDANRMIIEGL